jgi:hypothetical protein
LEEKSFTVGSTKGELTIARKFQSKKIGIKHLAYIEVKPRIPGRFGRK